jgi:hypothetical protein
LKVFWSLPGNVLEVAQKISVLRLIVTIDPMLEKKLLPKKIWLLLKIEQLKIWQRFFWAMPKNISINI